jgi:uncharacterized protein (TIGR02646 family)
MIFVQRSPAPAFLVKHIDMHSVDFASDGSGARLLVNPYPPTFRKDLLAALSHQFAGKCAYCESLLGVTSLGEIEQFRPKSMFGLEACFDWNNLLLSCAVCNRNKGARFPFEHDMSERVAQDSGRPAYGRPMLLHPCIDLPDEHLRFTADGHVHGLTPRGSVTIATLDLNRLQLVEARRRSVLEIRSRHFEVAQLTRDLPYLASKLHVLRFEIEDEFRAETERAREQQKRYDDAREQVATDKEDGLLDYGEFERYIERIELHNIGALAGLDLDLLVANQSRKPCFALLGENGIGKSTILRAVACALAGPAYARKLRLTSNSLLADDARTGSIMVRLTGYRDPVTVMLRRDRPLVYNSGGAKTLVLAYGASRLLATRRHKADPGERHAKIRNLLDPFVPVSDASSWLDQVQERHLNDVRETLERILNDTEHRTKQIVEVKDGKLRFNLTGAGSRPVTELSDGYKALIGMAGDIMAVMHAARFDKMEDAMGIVLVDELGNHFHPQLKLRIVGALRTAFPKIQFIYTTHEPLCLRGMEKGEIGVLRRDDQGVYLLTELPDVATMRVDQLLASEHFGLESTVAPERAAEIRRYHELMRKTERSDDEEAKLAQLRTVLAKTDYLGGSRRERMLLDLLDMHDVDPVRKPGANVSADALSRRTLSRLKEIMRAVGPGEAFEDDGK